MITDSNEGIYVEQKTTQPCFTYFQIAGMY